MPCSWRNWSMESTSTLSAPLASSSCSHSRAFSSFTAAPSILLSISSATCILDHKALHCVLSSDQKHTAKSFEGGREGEGESA